jgi:NAD(P)-dependent dehydrogenase (short-subunit alcohol dehydrogenase family)
VTFSQDVVIVTGAAGNVGAATVRLLAARGARAVAVERTAGKLAGAMPAGDHMADAADIGDAESCAALADRVLARYGRIDGLVNTVGTFVWAGIADADAAQWEQMFRVNLLTAVNMTRAVLPAMRAAKAGGIVYIAAGAAQRAPVGMSAYGASKSGLLRLMESVAAEVKGDGITANAVMPGIIDTPQNRAAMPGADTAGWVTPEQVAEAMLFFLSPAGRAVTAAAMPVTGRG